MLDGHLLNSFIKSQSEKHLHILSNPPPSPYTQYLNIWAENFGGISSSISDIWRKKIEDEEGGDYLY
jgi:hypothetical protein